MTVINKYQYMPHAIFNSSNKKKTLNNWSRGEKLILFSENLKGNKTYCFPRDQSLSDLLYNRKF